MIGFVNYQIKEGYKHGNSLSKYFCRCIEKHRFDNGFTA